MNIILLCLACLLGYVGLVAFAIALVTVGASADRRRKAAYMAEHDAGDAQNRECD